MRIARVDTVRYDAVPNAIHVEIHTDEGLAGLGETFFGARAVEAWIHETAAPALVGREADAVEELNAELVGYLGYASTGAETRGRSAIDIALWDLRAKAREVPLWRLLGGSANEPMPVYNTCAGPGYVGGISGQRVENWGLPARAPHRYDDLAGFLHDAGALAEDLLAEGFRAMKIWPLDPYAEASGGEHVSAADLERGVEPLRRVRAAVGADIDLMVELHGLWKGDAARRVVAAVEPFEPRWIEDPVRSDDVDLLAELCATSAAPIAAGETVAGREAFERMVERARLGLCILDLGWCGGISEALHVAAATQRRSIPLAAHDCTGPVVLAASTHFATAQPNVALQEVVRAFLASWYPDIAAGVPAVVDGTIRAGDAPGHGVALRPAALQAPGTRRETSGDGAARHMRKTP